MSSLDMSLDDLSKRGQSSRGGRGGRGGSSRGGASSGPIRNKPRHSGGGNAAPYARAPQMQYAPVALAYADNGQQWQRDLYQAPQIVQQQQQPEPQPQPVKKLSGDTVHVSNLASDVGDDDVREIFQVIGPVKSAIVNYTSQGKSTGTATVVFVQKAHAEKAVADYDDAEVDGRPMKLKLIGTVVTAPVVVKKQRPTVVQQAPQPAALPVLQQPIYLPQQMFAQQPQLQFAQSNQSNRSNKPAPARGGAATRGGATRGGRGGRGGASGAAPESAPRGGRGGSRGGRGGRTPQKEVTGADLDAEMDNYHTTAAKSAAPAAENGTTGQPTTV